MYYKNNKFYLSVIKNIFISFIWHQKYNGKNSKSSSHRWVSFLSFSISYNILTFDGAKSINPIWARKLFVLKISLTNFDLISVHRLYFIVGCTSCTPTNACEKKNTTKLFKDCNINKINRFGFTIVEHVRITSSYFTHKGRVLNSILYKSVNPLRAILLSKNLLYFFRDKVLYLYWAYYTCTYNSNISYTPFRRVLFCFLREMRLRERRIQRIFVRIPCYDVFLSILFFFF